MKIRSLFVMFVCLLIGFGLPRSSEAGLAKKKNEIKRVEINLEWSVENESLHIDSPKADYGLIESFLWNGRVVNDQMHRMIAGGAVDLIIKNGGFELLFKEVSFEIEEPGDFGIILFDGREIFVSIPSNPFPEEKTLGPAQLSTSLSASDSSCGQFSDSANPYPCCSNGNRPDGNCTWYAWYRAHQSFRGWNQVLPKWGNAKDWASGARKSGYKVSSTPRGYKEGYSMGVNTKGTYGHVVWVYDWDSKYVWVDEMNCCDCNVAGFRTGIKYARSYFDGGFIYKK